MKQQIKESYDQIHAPITLINETKQLVHTKIQQENDKNRKVRPKRKWVMATASMAACLCLVITGVVAVNWRAKDNTSPLPNTPVLVGENDTTKGTVFSSVANIETWKNDLTKIKENGAASTPLTKEYILYEMPLELNGTTYQVQIQITNGTVVLNESEYYLEGTYTCIVMDGSKILGTTALPITSSSQFTQTSVEMQVEDHNNDGTKDFLLQNSQSDNSFEEIWYQIGSDYKASPIK